MKFVTIHELVRSTKSKIEQLNHILDVLLSGYRAASEIIDPECDHRQKYLEQLKELNETLANFTEEHPALYVDTSWQNAVRQITSIAASGEQIYGTVNKQCKNEQ